MGFFRKISRKHSKDRLSKTPLEENSVKGSVEFSVADSFEDVDSVVKRGPFDIEQDYPKAKRLNMGAVRIPAIAGVQVHPEPSGRPDLFSSVTLLVNDSAINLMVLSDTKTGTTWDDLEKLLVNDATRSGSTVTKSVSEFGRELEISKPVTAPDGRLGQEKARYIGISGPRWVLRVIISGKALFDDQARSDVEEILASTVVDRGQNPIPPGEILLLELPEHLDEMLNSKE